ncbi:Alpha Beta hydrolase protein [Rutstroemia sp. NJR-2017a WRK4]|nr:Alpha Beta hydrolase protein [Rutstroemia sp. NJR-2017a WRK4]
MYSLASLLGLSAFAFALPKPSADLSSHCKSISIPITVSVPRYILSTSIHDNWDAAALTFNLTSNDFTTSSDPLPITGITPTPINSTYTIGATLCGTGGSPTLILTHGIIESKLYWSPNLPDSDQYNFVKAAVGAGYSVLYYDRLGVGSSSTVNSTTDAQFPVEVSILNTLIAYSRTYFNSTSTSLLGHSYGSYISTASASQINVDALILTGFSGTIANFGPFLAGASFRVARLQNPSRWGHLDPGFLTSADLYAETYVYFASPHFEHRIAEWTYEVASEPFAVAELPTLLATDIKFEDIKAPTLVLQGRYDVSACGGECVGVINKTTKALFSGAEDFEFVDDLEAGVAPKAFQIVFDFLKAHDV